MWWALVLLGVLYGSALCAPWVAPYGEHWHNTQLANAPPTCIYWRPETGFYIRRIAKQFNPETYRFDWRLTPDTTRYPLGFWVKDAQGQPHLLAPVGTVRSIVPPSFHLLGTDANGRDLFSRMLYGGRVSLTLGFVSLIIAYPIGLLYGGISGYLGGWVDTLMMRGAEVLMSVPSLYLLMALAAMMPPTLSSATRFVLVSVMLALIGWAGLARIIRGMVLSLRTQDYIEAARVLGCSPWRLIVRHLLPQTWHYVLVTMTLAIPGYLLAESGLSFLGLGIQQPSASWGNLLKDAQNIPALSQQPWLLMPGLLILLTVIAFNRLGEGLKARV